MTNEEWNRKTEFLLNQQAKFDAEMQVLKQELKEAQKINDQKFGDAARMTEHVAESVMTLAETVKDFITSTHEGFRSLFNSLKHSNERIDVLVNSQIHTDERILDSYKRMRESEKRLSEHDIRLQDLTTQFEQYLRKIRRRPNGAEN
jgi:small-conductance mechanosensitive channel